MTTLINDFHNTTATVRAAIYSSISRRTERRVWNALCGIADCQCSSDGGVRGGEYALKPWGNGTRYQVVDHFDV